MEGRIRCSKKIVDKPGTLVATHTEIDVAREPYVSRGALKLKSAFDDFSLSAEGLHAVDAGASTGGFTDFLLQQGAKKVVAVDVGYGQLSWKLRQSEKVMVLERTNIRYLDTAQLPFLADLTVADLSFISLKTVLEKLLAITRKGGSLLLLFKPQFELKKEKVQAKGVIRDQSLHLEALQDFFDFLSRFSLEIADLSFSKIRGTKGNIEYWIHIIKNPTDNHGKYDKMISNVVAQSHQYFRQKGIQ